MAEVIKAEDTMGDGHERIDSWPLPEAGASWTVRYTTAAGFDAMLTLRGHDGAELIPKVVAAEKWLLEHGAQGNAKAKTSSSSNANGTNGTGAKVCAIHGVEMRRFEKDGRSWWSHKTDDGWCKGK